MALFVSTAPLGVSSIYSPLKLDILEMQVTPSKPETKSPNSDLGSIFFLQTVKCRKVDVFIILWHLGTFCSF